MCLNALGALVWREWVKSFEIRQECRPGAFVVMPNHWHGVIHILDTANAFPESDTKETFSSPSGHSVPAFMRGLKSSITSSARRELHWADGPVCQSRYWEHVVRNEADHDRIDAYIRNNPAHWQQDCFNR